MPFLPLPAVVAHADWSVDPKKRWVALARRDGTNFRAAAPQPVGPLETFLARLSAGADAPVLLGVDFPLGLPVAYAASAGIDDFRAWLSGLGRGRWSEFFAVAERPEQVAPTRPFFPARPGTKGEFSRRQLLDGLGLETYTDLLRRCDHATRARPAAAPLFWTLGPQQVGKAALTAWRDLLIPTLAAGQDLAIWPFDGPLHDLLAAGPGRVVIAETYPAEVYGHLGVAFPRPVPGARGGKRVQAARAANAHLLLDRARALDLALAPELQAAIEDGFGAAPAGEDPFDATVGLFGMLNVLRGNRPPADPDDPVTRNIEGWILGQRDDCAAQPVSL